jgi:hypothetical protein
MCLTQVTVDEGRPEEMVDEHYILQKASILSSANLHNPRAPRFQSHHVKIITQQLQH